MVAVRESATTLTNLIAPLTVADFIRGNFGNQVDKDYITGIRDAIVVFQFALSEELRQLPAYIVTEKGNLSHIKLVDGASKGYSTETVGLLDDFIRFEIDESGRCLGFGLFTACGYHILRAVEVAIKGYIVAATGQLPKLNRRNWSVYIEQLEIAGASSNLTDLIKILKTKRNPLMHPQETLKEKDAIGLFSICQTVIEELVNEVYDKHLNTKFKEALIILPTL